MNLPEIAIRRPVFAWMLMAALILFGGISASRMGISQLPDVDFPVVSVRVDYPGAAPEVIETNVVDVIEDAVMTVEGVRSVSSTARYAQASISVEFELSRDISDALQEVQNKVAAAQRNLPSDIEPPVISKTNPEDQPILWMSVTSDRHSVRELMRYVKDSLKDRFSSVTGVGEITLGGYVDPNLRVWISGKELSRYELAVTDVLNAISAEHSELPAGQITTGRKEYDVRTLGEAKTAKEFENIVINQRGGQPVYSRIRLGQVAQIEDGLDDIRRISRANSERAVGIGIRKQRGANTVAVAQGVKARMAEVAKQLPEGMKIDVNFDSTKFIEESVDEFKMALVLSALATAFVCWLFLGSWTATLNVILAIPTSIIGTFIVLYFFGFTLNTFTLLGLSLAIGIVVDDAIMVLENIVRHQEKGENRVEAALKGSRQVTFAALAATLAVVAIFLPVAFMSGVIGKFFFQFGITMTVAVLLSLLEALTLTPMRASQFVQAGSRVTRMGRAADFAFRAVAALYGKLLALALRHPWIIIGGSLLFFVASFSTLNFINKEFMPAQDQSSFIVRAQTPIDSSMEFTDSVIREAEKFFASRPEIRRYMVAVGGFGTGGQSNLTNAFISMKPKGERGIDPEAGHELSQQELMGVTREALKKLGLKVSIQDLSQRGFTASRGFPVEFAVQGRNWDKLVEYSETIIAKLEATGLVTDTDSDYLLGKPEIRIIPDRERAAARGVSIQAISQTVNAMVGGVVAGQYSSEGHRYDVRVRLRDQDIDRIDQIRRLYVRNNRGELIPLSEVVQVREDRALAQINRNDRERAIKIFANVATGKSQQEALDRAQAIAHEVLPPEYRVQFVGGSQSFQESFASLWFVLILGVIVAYMVLASQFNSFIHPVTVLMALPFSVSGAFLTLLLFDNSLNIFSFIGLILLMGIVKKNSILLVDFTNQVRDRGGVTVRDALIEACPIRLRPILMTSFATIAAALPLALALGPGAELRAPMAIAVIGGVLVSTLLTLFVVPCVYELLARFERDRRAVDKRHQEIVEATEKVTNEL
ncbi:acriflavin resistance protein [Sulfuricaulis limicola]|uniref:Acriflavin resistance protein n=1 Tax=Sulfuricaulis limicola TaxID=1620215 RepID=A0A1B4XCR7_9GAMM|nr:efflux RND transporter permease subunit [Sulfuricaulis limicola]BAV32614.1 acriflavin resistance protein [Sulfuricaulis limicola]